MTRVRYSRSSGRVTRVGCRRCCRVGRVTRSRLLRRGVAGMRACRLLCVPCMGGSACRCRRVTRVSVVARRCAGNVPGMRTVR